MNTTTSLTFAEFLKGNVVATYIEHPNNGPAIHNLHRLLEGLDPETLDEYVQAVNAHPEKGERLQNLRRELEAEQQRRCR